MLQFVNNSRLVLFGALLLLVGLFGSATTTVSTVHANSSLQVSVLCEDAPAQSPLVGFSCTAIASGTDSVLSYRWQVNNGSISNGRFSLAISGTCIHNAFVTGTVTVTGEEDEVVVQSFTHRCQQSNQY